MKNVNNKIAVSPSCPTTGSTAVEGNAERPPAHEHQWVDKGDDYFLHPRHKKIVYWRYYCSISGCDAKSGHVNDRTFF